MHNLGWSIGIALGMLFVFFYEKYNNTKRCGTCDYFKAKKENVCSWCTRKNKYTHHSCKECKDYAVKLFRMG